MLDWLVEVTTVLKCRDRTYYLAASLFDKFLKQFLDILENIDVHGIGITCLYLASKYEDFPPLSLKVISNNIAHKAFSESSIKKKEMTILKTLEFGLDMVTHYDLHVNLLLSARLQSEIMNQNLTKILLTKISELSTLILLMTMQHPDFYSFSMPKIVVSAIIGACCILQAQPWLSSWDDSEDDSECPIDLFKKIFWSDS